MKEQRYPPKNIAVIVNPVTGGGSARRVWPEIARLLAGFGMEFTCDFTDKPGAGTELAKRALHRGCDCVVAAGGDGTVNEVVNGLLAEGGPAKARLGIIPCGSGRDLARTLGIPRSPADAVALLAAGRTRLVDVGRIDFRTEDGGSAGRYFLNIADAGLGGETANRVNRMGKKAGGFLSFLLGALVTVFTYRSKQVTISFNGGPPEPVDLTTIAMANGKYFAGGMMIAPHAKMDDGVFDLITVYEMKRFELLLNLYLVYSGRHIRHPKVTVRRGSRVFIDAKEQVYIEADGEVIGFLPAEFTVLPEVLSVIC